jgi:hypothetical protein
VLVGVGKLFDWHLTASGHLSSTRKIRVDNTFHVSSVGAMHIELDQDGLRRHARAAGIDIYKFYGRQLAERTGLSQPGISTVLMGKTNPGARFVAHMLGLFGSAAFTDIFRIAN